MSGANAIIKINNISNDILNFSSYETGNSDFLANGFNTKIGLFMILLTPANAESEIIKDIQLMGGNVSDEQWLKENVAKFILTFLVVEKNNTIQSSEEEDELRNKIEQEENNSSTIEALIKYAPNTIYNLLITDPKYLSHLQPGLIYETTAHDVA